MREPIADSKFVRSIKKGILASPIVNEVSYNQFDTIVGNRRVTAVMKAGGKSILCKVVVASEEEVFKMTLTENLQREDPRPMEAAVFISNYMSAHNTSVAEIADMVDLDRSTISNLIRVFNHPVMRNQVIDGHYSMPAALAAKR